MRLVHRPVAALAAASVALGIATAAFPQAKTRSFAPTDREMNRAVAEARKNLPRFLEQLRSRTAERYSVKIAIPVPHTDDREHIWMRLEAVDGDGLTGRISNDPERLPELYFDAPYRATMNMVSDWSYWMNGVRYGNYTTRVILNYMPKAEADAIRKTLSETP